MVDSLLVATVVIVIIKSYPRDDEVTDTNHQEVMTTDNLTSTNSDGNRVSNINYSSTTLMQFNENSKQCPNAASKDFVEMFMPSSSEVAMHVHKILVLKV